MNDSRTQTEQLLWVANPTARKYQPAQKIIKYFWKIPPQENTPFFLTRWLECQPEKSWSDADGDGDT